MGESFAALLEATARRQPEATALVWDGGALTFRDLERRAGGVARALAARGARAGDVIALALPNGWPFVAAFLGTLKLGATVVPLNPLLSPSERERVTGHLGPKLMIESVTEEEADWPAVACDAPALILYTSGSTGEPKGSLLSHRALRLANESWAEPVMALGPADTVLAVLPLAHSFGLNGALLAPLLAGSSVCLMERFVPEEVLTAIARHRVTVLPAVATMFRRLLDSPALPAVDLSSLRLAVSGAAPCPWEIAEEWRRRTGVRLLRGYGMTELFRPISYLEGDPRDVPDAIGRPVPGVEVCLVAEDGQVLGADEVGELWIKSPAALDGYLGAPEATRAVLEDGWFKTGDLATHSPEGFVKIVGRKKDLILRGGYSVVPGEVEAVLLSHPAVAEAAVVGAPHATLGEEIAAFVTLRPDTAAAPDDLIAHCRERLAAFKYPRRVTIVPELPKSPTGKILKSRLTP
jgi:long-chain acyl-CoA synthetase